MGQDWLSYTFFIYSQPSFLLEITLLVITCMLKFKIFLEINQIYYKILDKYEKIYMEAKAEPDEPPRPNKSGEIRRRLHKLIKDAHKGNYNEEEKNEVKKLIYEDLASKKFTLRDGKLLKNEVKGDCLKYQNSQADIKKRLKTIIGGIDAGAKWRKILKCIPEKEIESIPHTSPPEDIVRELKRDRSDHRELLFRTKKEMPRGDLAKRVEKLLSVTPSEYVRKDIERMRRELHRAQKSPRRLIGFEFHRDTCKGPRCND